MMRKERMEIEELKDLLKQNPDGVELVCDDGHYQHGMREIKVINVYKDRFVFIYIGDNITSDNITSDNISSLKHYPSQKPQRKLIELFHCYSGVGIIGLYDVKERYPLFREKRMCIYSGTIKKCYHLPSVFIDAETFEFVEVKE